MEPSRKFPLVPLLVAAAVVFYSFNHLFHVLIPFGLSFAIAYVANPFINYLVGRGLRRDVVVVAIYIIVALAITMLASRFIRVATAEFSSLQTQAPLYMARGKHLITTLQKEVARRMPYGSRLVEQWDASLYGPIIEQAQNIPSYVLDIFPLLSFLFLIPFITFFLLKDGPDVIEHMIQICPSRYVEQALNLIFEIDVSLGNYLRGIIIVAAAISGVSFIGLYAMNLHQALAISVLSGLSSFVPYLGAIIGAIVGGLAASFQFGTALAGLKVVLLFLLIRLADEMFLQPVIARHSVRLHPLLFLLSLLVGGEIFGFIGLVFAVPAACILKALITVGWDWYSSEARISAPLPAMEAAEVPYV